MNRLLATTLLGLSCSGLFLSLPGCGGDEQAAAPTASISSAQKAAAGGRQSPQADVVHRFLQAVQKGDRDAAMKLLTAKAVQKIEEYNLPFLPSAIDTASFRVGQTIPRGQTCFVQCVWTDQDPTGQAQTEVIQWMLKEEKSGIWGIFGMAVHVDPSEPPMVFNFEQPDELVRRQQEIAQAGSPTQQGATEQTAPQQANRVQDPFQSSRR